VDSGSSVTCTNDSSDFDVGTLQKLPEPKQLGGIAGGIEVQYEGMLTWETLDLEGNKAVFKTRALLAPSLPCRLFSPQSFLSGTQNIDDHFPVYGNRSEWHMHGRKLITMDYDRSFLPRMTLFKAGTTEHMLQALNGNVMAETNQNISPLKRIWLQWHQKLGHPGFYLVQQLGLGGFLNKAALSLTRDMFQHPPFCAACQFGKQSRKPSGTIHIKCNTLASGLLKRGQLSPGDLMFMDQLESRTKGCPFTLSGREHQVDRFKGSTIFCGTASGLLHIEHQVMFTANETIQSKVSFERMSPDHGTNIRNYHSDNNGVFKASDFLNELHAQGQSIKFSTTRAHWQNGIAENAIKIAVTCACTMMIHYSLHWPDKYNESLWPMAISYAVHLYNNTPNRESGIAPIETFTGALSNYQALRNAHVWGSPVYVLEPRLTESGGKIPKWQPRSCRGQFMGTSPDHAETLSLVKNCRTLATSPHSFTLSSMNGLKQ